jgi:hypothetical protein
MDLPVNLEVVVQMKWDLKEKTASIPGPILLLLLF